MRQVNKEPDESEFVSAEDYEKSAPASFGLPETPVLYLNLALSHYRICVASDGVHLWDGELDIINDLDSVTTAGHLLKCPSRHVDLETDLNAVAVQAALGKCRQLFGSFSGDDSIEIAVPREYETGDADDLGDATLLQSFGEGMKSVDGPAIAQKRRRSST